MVDSESKLAAYSSECCISRVLQPETINSADLLMSFSHSYKYATFCIYDTIQAMQL